MGEPSGRKEVDPDYAKAFALAQRVTDDAQRDLLLKACGRAIEVEHSTRIVAEATSLVAYWRSMPEHITGSMATRQLEDVLAGGRAPRNSSTAAKK